MGNTQAQITGSDQIQPLLYERAVRKDWKSVVERCSSNPEEADYVHLVRHESTVVRNTALHEICREQNDSSSTGFPSYAIFVEMGSNPTKSAPSQLDALVALSDISSFAASVQDQHEQTPLHIVCAHRKISVNFLETLVSIFPPAICMKDNKNRTPLHLLCENVNQDEICLEAMKVLVTASTDVVSLRDSRGRVPLHHICSNLVHKMSIDMAVFLASLCPKTVSMQDKDGVTPLHMLCRQRSSYVTIKVARFLAEISPHAVTVQDNEGKTPFHILCEYLNEGVLLDAMRLLPKNFSLPLFTIKDKHGDTPLHLFFMDNKKRQWNINLMRIFLRSAIIASAIDWKKEVKPAIRSSNLSIFQDCQGRTPLHLACNKLQIHGSTAIIEILVKMCSSAVCVQDSWGMTPLHIIFSHPISPKTIIITQTLLKKNACCLLIQDAQGWTPLHILCHRLNQKLAKDLVKQIAKACPLAAAVQDNSGKTPLHIVCDRSDGRASSHVVKLLVRSYPQSASVKDENGLLPLHKMLCQETLSYSVRTLVEAYPKAAHTVDNRDRPPFLILFEKNMDKMKELYEKKNFFDPDTILDDGMQDFLEKTSIIIENAYFSMSECTLKSGHILHAALEIVGGYYANYTKPFTSKDINLKYLAEHFTLGIVKLHPHMVFCKDGYGNFPLHIAAANPLTPTKGKKNRIMYGQGGSNIIQSLLETLPAVARIRNRNGLLPLEIAIQSGTTWSGGIKVLLEAFPEALASPTINIHLFPDILEQCSWTNNGLDVLFKIIKSKPELTKHFLPDS